jgi:hypothetical protein
MLASEIKKEMDMPYRLTSPLTAIIPPVNRDWSNAPKVFVFSGVPSIVVGRWYTDFSQN